MSEYNASYDEYIDYLERVILSSQGDKLPPYGLLGTARPNTADLKDAVTRMRAWRASKGSNPDKIWFCKQSSGNTNCKESVRYTVLKQESPSKVPGTKKTCGPTAIAEALVEWGINVDNGTVASYVGTGAGWAGTDPAGIVAGVPKLTKEKFGIPCKVTRMNHSEIGGFPGIGNILADPNRTLITQVAYGSTATDCNHYNAPVRVCFNEQQITVAENWTGEYDVLSFDYFLSKYVQRCSQKSYYVISKT